MKESKKSKNNGEVHKRIGKKKKKNRVAMRIVILMLCILILTGIANLVYRIKENGGGVTGTLATLLGENKESLEKVEPIQMLILGVSGIDDYKLADTIMVASYNPKTQSASIMSIPRDTYVGSKNKNTATQNYLASYKINSVYRNGTNIPDMIDRINTLTGLELTNYVVIDTQALIKLVDAIGGVTFNVPIDMYYTEDTEQNLYIDLKAGEQVIDGAKAEQLLRFRHNNDGSTYPTSYGQQDLGRMRTQREFIVATLQQTLKVQNIFKLKQIIDIMAENVTTNMDISSLKSYVPYAVKFDTNNIKTGVVPGDSEMCNGVSIYVANKTQTKKLVEELFTQEETTDENSSNGNSTNSSGTSNSNTTTNSSSTTNTNSTNTVKSSSSNKSVKIEVLNGSGSSSALSEVVNALKNAGYTVSKQGTTNTTKKTTITNKTNQSSDVTDKIKEILGVESVSKGTDNSDVDISIVIGQDY